MRKIKFPSLLVILMTFASCSSEDEPKNLADNATGNYTGYTVASCNYLSNMVSTDQTVKLTSAELNKVNISYESDTWGSIIVNGAELSGEDGNLLIKGSGKSQMSHAGNTSEYDCSVEGTLVGEDLSLSFFCSQVMGGLKVEFKQGDIPAEIIVPGTYSGYTEAKSAYFSGMMADGQKIVITRNGDKTYKVAYSSDTWGEFVIDAATVQSTTDVITIRGDGTTQMGMNGNVQDYACSIEGSIDISKENPTFTFSVPTVMGGLSIVFHTGDMPAEELVEYGNS